MIIRWKPVSMDHFLTQWNGMTIELKKEPKGWRGYVDGKRTNLIELKAAQAKARVETTAQKIIMNLVRANQQTQRAAA